MDKWQIQQIFIDSDGKEINGSYYVSFFRVYLKLSATFNVRSGFMTLSSFNIAYVWQGKIPRGFIVCGCYIPNKNKQYKDQKGITHGIKNLQHKIHVSYVKKHNMRHLSYVFQLIK